MDHRVKPSSPEDLLVHYGVRGMKWGQRRANRKEMRSLNKVSRQKDREERNRQIDTARGRLHSGELSRDYASAKSEYKSQRHVVGRREAGKVLKAKREKLDAEYRLSQETKHGAETTAAVLGTVGGVVIGTAAAAALTRR